MSKAYLNRNPYVDFGLAQDVIAVVDPSQLSNEEAVQFFVQMSLCHAYAPNVNLREALFWADRVDEEAGLVARANVLWAAGFANFKAKLPMEAVAALEAGLALWRDVAPVRPDELEICMKLHNVLGSVHLSLDHFDECERELDTTIQLSESTGQNPLGRAIAFGLSGRSILRRAALLSDSKEASRELVREAQRRFRANDELSEKTSSITGLLLNRSSLGDCARLLEDFEDLLACGKLLHKRASKYSDVSAQCVGLCMQIEAGKKLGRDTTAAETELIEHLPHVQKEKKGTVESAMKRFS